MAEVSKQIANWTLVTRTVESALEQQGPELARELEKELFPDGPPADLTLAAVLEAMRAALHRRLEKARDEDLALAVERADDPAARDRRDEAIDALRATLMAARSTIEGLFGDDAVVRTGLDGRLPDSPDALVQEARAAASILADTDLGEPAPGVQFDGAQFAAQLRESADRLAEALRAVQRESREEQQAMHARDESVAALSACYRGIAGATVGLATTVGRDDVAERVRPTARRRSGLPEPADQPPPASPAAAEPTPAQPDGGAPAPGE